MSVDSSETIQQQVLEAYSNETPVNIVGGNSKAFYGHQVQARPLDVSGHSGILSMNPPSW